MSSEVDTSLSLPERPLDTLGVTESCMLEKYRPEDFREVAHFARKCTNSFYVKLIIKAHTKDGFPGECHVWREGGRIVAFAAVAYLNTDDAWLWGMRVDPEFRSKGVAAKFTQAQLRIAKAWAGRGPG